MRNILISIISIAALSAALQLLLPWWSIALAAFAIAYLRMLSLPAAFTAGFLAIFLLWSGYAAWLSIANEHILAARVARLLPLGGSVWALLLLTGAVGGITAGLSALCGAYARRLYGS
ncbi:MAG: hypothetical protein NZM35_06760 [Chitinophagales bacterium]|nr:hypothetical protein [Chitinophagales bacterium]MDW8418645.1 hypothetical protein [Chitinophagales bacterium]